MPRAEASKFSMKKITLYQLCKIFDKHNSEARITQQYSDQSPLTGVVVFKQSNYTKVYSEQSRSYAFTSDNKYFIPEMGGSSIFAECLDGSEHMVRLDYYVGQWDIEYCYIKENKA